MEQTYFIYKITDPRDDKPFYVGKTCSPEVRFNNHCSSGKTTKVGSVLNEVFKTGLRPVFSIIDECSAVDSDKVEADWIERLTIDGFNLINRLYSKTGRYEVVYENGITEESIKTKAASNTKYKKLGNAEWSKGISKAIKSLEIDGESIEFIKADHNIISIKTLISRFRKRTNPPMNLLYTEDELSIKIYRKSF